MCVDHQLFCHMSEQHSFSNMSDFERCESAADFEFVAELEKYPCIWDKACPDYKDKNKKSIAWEKLAEASQFTDVQARYKTIRNKLSRRQAAPPSGSGTKIIKIWTLEPSLAFLVGNLCARKTKSSFVKSTPKPAAVPDNDTNNHDKVDEDFHEDQPPAVKGTQDIIIEEEFEGLIQEDDMEVIFEIPPLTPETVTTTKAQKPLLKRKAGTTDVFNAALEAIAKMPAPTFPAMPKFPELPPPPVEDAHMAFGRSVGLSLRDMPPAVASRLKSKIFALIAEEEQHL